MGCKGLWAFLNEIITEIPIDKLKGKPIVVDIMLYIYKYIIGIRNTGRDITSINGDNINHIYAIYNLVKNFSDNGILPICVFDGKSPEIKKDSVEKRKLISEIAGEKCKLIESTMNDDENDNDIISAEYIKNFKKSVAINTSIVNECKLFLDFLGIPYVDSFGEADSECAGISHYYKNIISGVLSEDTDVIIFGGTVLYRDFDLKTNTVKMLELEKILLYLQQKTNIICRKLLKNPLIFTIDNFIDFTIILGNDYGHGIRCSGGNNREKLFELFVLNNFNIINFVAHLYQINKHIGFIKYYIPEYFIEKWVISKDNYKNAEIIDPSSIKIHMSMPNYEELKQYLLINKFNIYQTIIINNTIKRLYQLYSEDNFCYESKDDWITVSHNSRKKHMSKLNYFV